MDDSKYESLMEIGRGQAAVISEMVAALECDYDALETLKERKADPDDTLTASEEEELAELIMAAGECESRDDAEQRIHEDALSVEVRTGWYTPNSEERQAPEEYNILLATGGPAARITGELRDSEPSSARLQVQDWGTPWTDYWKTIDEDTLLTYARCFYFGES